MRSHEHYEELYHVKQKLLDTNICLAEAASIL